MPRNINHANHVASALQHPRQVSHVTKINSRSLCSGASLKLCRRAPEVRYSSGDSSPPALALSRGGGWSTILESSAMFVLPTPIFVEPIRLSAGRLIQVLAACIADSQTSQGFGTRGRITQPGIQAPTLSIAGSRKPRCHGIGVEDFFLRGMDPAGSQSQRRTCRVGNGCVERRAILGVDCQARSAA